MADTPNPEKKIKTNAAKTADSAADEGASLAEATQRSTAARCIREKGQARP